MDEVSHLLAQQLLVHVRCTWTSFWRQNLYSKWFSDSPLWRNFHRYCSFLSENAIGGQYYGKGKLSWLWWKMQLLSKLLGCERSYFFLYCEKTLSDPSSTKINTNNIRSVFSFTMETKSIFKKLEKSLIWWLSMPQRHLNQANFLLGTIGSLLKAFSLCSFRFHVIVRSLIDSLTYRSYSLCSRGWFLSESKLGSKSEMSDPIDDWWKPVSGLDWDHSIKPGHRIVRLAMGMTKRDMA